jgi:hypothetical protein
MQADLSVLACSSALNAVPDSNADHLEQSVAWAKSFWSQNWHLTECQPAELAKKPAAQPSPDPAPLYEPAPGEVEELSDQVKQLFRSFIKAVLDKSRDVNVYDRRATRSSVGS